MLRESYEPPSDISSTSSVLSLVMDLAVGDILGERALCEPGDLGGRRLELECCLWGALRDCCLIMACWRACELDLGTWGDTGVASCSPMAGSGDIDLGISK